jgi:hypothetical protein
MGIGKVGGNHHGGRGKRIDGKDRATVEEPGGIWKSVCLHRCVGRSTNVPALTSYCCTGARRFKLQRYHVVAFCSAASLKRSTPGTDACSASESRSMVACRAVEVTTAKMKSTSEDVDLNGAAKGNLWGFLRADDTGGELEMVVGAKVRDMVWSRG